MSVNAPSTAITARAVVHAAGVLRAAWAALTTGSRTIPFGDNGALFRELAAHIAASNRRTRDL